MNTRWRAALRSTLLSFFLLVLAASMTTACSSTTNGPGEGTGGPPTETGQGGAGGQPGSPVDASDDRTIDAEGAAFTCGGETCIPGRSYCRKRGGQFLPDGSTGQGIDQCWPFDSSCSPHDCSCVVVNQGDTYCPATGCTQTPSGQVTARCGPV